MALFFAGFVDLAKPVLRSIDDAWLIYALSIIGFPTGTLNIAYFFHALTISKSGPCDQINNLTVLPWPHSKPWEPLIAFSRGSIYRESFAKITGKYQPSLSKTTRFSQLILHYAVDSRIIFLEARKGLWVYDDLSSREHEWLNIQACF